MIYLYSFLVGGLICTAAQVLIDKTRLTPARILVIYVCTGVLLSAVGLYEPLVRFAGAGATVPLTGFGHVIAKGVRAGVRDDSLLGALGGGLEASASGIGAALLFSIAAALIFRSKPKK